MDARDPVGPKGPQLCPPGARGAPGTGPGACKMRISISSEMLIAKLANRMPVT